MRLAKHAFYKRENPMPLKYLGPFIGYTQSSEVKIWLHKTGMVAGEIELVYVAIKKSAALIH